MSEIIHTVQHSDREQQIDTVDHATLLRRIELSYGIHGMALSWLRSYLSDRTQLVHSGSTSSRPTVLRYGVPHGSVLGLLMQIVFLPVKKKRFLPVKNPLPFLPVKYKFYQLISETKITLKK